MTHPITWKDSAPSRQRTWKKNCAYRQTWLATHHRLTCNRGTEASAPDGGTQGAGQVSSRHPPCRSVKHGGPSACPLTLPRALPARPQAHPSWALRRQAGACERQHLWGVSQGTSAASSHPSSVVHSSTATNARSPSQGQVESHFSPPNTGQSSDSLLTNSTGQKGRRGSPEARLE